MTALTDRFRDALATAADGQLRELAQPWSTTEELALFEDEEMVEHVREDLVELAGLARRAREAGHRLYCYVTA